MDFEKELDIGLPRSGANEGKIGGREGGPTMTIPPQPPAKEPSKRPAPLKLDTTGPGPSPTEPPNRPLPPRPTSKIDVSRPKTQLSEVPNKPAPTRPPPLRPQAPLAMNPPTRPGTAVTQKSGTTAPMRFPGSTKRLSWTSIASSRRPIKYGQGKYSRVELVPQPSDDPDDPLVCPISYRAH